MLEQRFDLPDPYARVDGHAHVVREPIWGLVTPLLPLERRLVRSPLLRRLHFVAHGGVAALSSGYVHTRLQHVLGVFALTARFAPNDRHARVAALLHDVGHPPFSHALEALPGVDHHRWTAEQVLDGEVAEALRADDLDPQRVLDLAEGRVRSVLKNQDGVLHLDHLDSLVRSAWMRGTLCYPAAKLLGRLTCDVDRIAFSPEAAEMTKRLILEEAYLHGEATDIAPAAVLSGLVAQLIADGQVPLDSLPHLTDAELIAQLHAHPATGEEARRLWTSPWRLRLARLGDREAPPRGARLALKDRLYLDPPHVHGWSEGERDACRAELEASTAGLTGRFAVAWDDEGFGAGFGAA